MDAFIKITNEISKRIILTKFSTLKILPKYVDNQRRTTFTKSVLTSPKKKKTQRRWYNQNPKATSKIFSGKLIKIWGSSLHCLNWHWLRGILNKRWYGFLKTINNYSITVNWHTNVHLKISLYICVHIKTVPWKILILNSRNSRVICPWSL